MNNSVCTEITSSMWGCLPQERVDGEYECIQEFVGQVYHQPEYVPITAMPFPPRKESCFARCIKRVCTAKATHMAIGGMLSLAGIVMFTVADTSNFGATGETGKVMTVAGVISFISGLIWTTVGIVTIDSSERSGGDDDNLPLLPNSGKSGRTLTKYV